MWIYSDIGFFSIVQKDGEGTLTIRARVRDDLRRLKEVGISLGNSEIIETDDSDYRYRIVAPQRSALAALMILIAKIDYDNFKDQIGHTHPLRKPYYSEIWGQTMRLEEIDGIED